MDKTIQHIIILIIIYTWTMGAQAAYSQGISPTMLSYSFMQQNPFFTGGINKKAYANCEQRIIPLCQQKINPFQYLQCAYQEMQKVASCTQAAILLNKMNVRSLEKITTYGSVDIVTAQVVMADRSSRIFMVGHAGDLVELINNNAFLSNNNDYARLVKHFPHYMLWDDLTSKNIAPQVIPVKIGGIRIVWQQRLTDGCWACTEIGTATIAYDFDKQGHFRHASVINISYK